MVKLFVCNLGYIQMVVSIQKSIRLWKEYITKAKGGNQAQAFGVLWVPLALWESKTRGINMLVGQRDKQSSKQRRKLGDDFLRLFTLSLVHLERRRVWLPAGSPFVLLWGCSISASLGGWTSVDSKAWKLERQSVISINSSRLFASSAQQDCNRGTKSFGTSSRLGLTFWKAKKHKSWKWCDRIWRLLKHVL